MRFRCIGLLIVVVLYAAAGHVQQRPAEVPLQIPNPHYVAINESIDVDAPVDKVWARVGRLLRHHRMDEFTRMEDLQVSAGDGGPGSGTIHCE